MREVAVSSPASWKSSGPETAAPGLQPAQLIAVANMEIQFT